MERGGGKSSRLARGRLVLAVEPGRLPTLDRVRKDHSWESAFVPHLNSKTSAHLYHVRPLVTRVGLLDRLRATREYVLEETQYGRQPKKFSHMDTKASRYTMVFGEKWWSCAPNKFNKP